MKQYGAIILLSMSMPYLQAVGPEKYHLTFEQYKNTQVPKKLQNKFHRFYNKMLDKHLELKDANPKMAKRRKQKIRCVGMTRIEKKHPATFRAIANKITRKETPKAEKKKIEKYILREGYLAKFFKAIERSEKNVWGLTKQYTREAWQKMRSGVSDVYGKITKPGAKKPNGKTVQSRRMRKKKKTA